MWWFLCCSFRLLFGCLVLVLSAVLVEGSTLCLPRRRKRMLRELSTGLPIPLSLSVVGVCLRVEMAKWRS